MRIGRLFRCAGVAFSLGVLWPSLPAAAADSKTEAVAHFQRGRDLIRNEQFADALEELQRSYDLLPSPNTLLLMAHAERGMGEDVQAAELYERVVREAQERIDQGEVRFEQTKEDANHWLGQLSKSLGRLKLVLLHVPEGTRVRVDGKRVKLEREGEDTFRSKKMWWRAGTAEVTADVPGGDRVTTKVDVEPGETANVTLDIRTASRVEEEDEQSKQSEQVDEPDEGGVSTMTWVGLGAGVVGFGTFTVFGLMSQSKAEELDKCAPHCPSSMKDVGDAGKTYQAVANVGLVVGSVGLLTAFAYYLADGSSEKQTDSKEVTKLRVGPQGVWVTGRF